MAAPGPEAQQQPSGTNHLWARPQAQIFSAQLLPKPGRSAAQLPQKIQQSLNPALQRSCRKPRGQDPALQRSCRKPRAKTQPCNAAAENQGPLPCNAAAGNQCLFPTSAQRQGHPQRSAIARKVTRGFSPTSCNLSRRCNAARKRSSRAQSQIHSSSAHMICAAQQRKFNLGFRACAAQSQPQICQSLRRPISQIRSASSARSHTLTVSDHSAMLCSHVLSAARQRKFNLGFRVWAAQSQPQICQSLRHTFTDQICQLCAQSHSQFQIRQSFQAALQLEPNHCQLPRSLSLERGILNGR